MNNTILITGALGYVGGRVSRFLSKQMSCNLKIATRNENQVNPEWLNDGELVKLDLFNEEKLVDLCSGVKYIIHFAAMNEIDSSSSPVTALTVNGVGTLNLLNAAIKTGVQRFIYISTAHVYGAPLQGTITENTLPRPLHPYAISHKTAEDYVLAAHDRGIIESVVLRLSNGFGCPERANVNRWTLLVNDLCKQVVTTKKIVLNSSGIQVRDFITLEDISRAIEHVLKMTDVDLEDGLFNLGGENAIRVLDMAEIVADRSSKTINLKLNIERPKPKGREALLKLDYCIDKLKSTGYSLKSNINEEIDDTLKLCMKTFEFGAQ